MLDHIIVNFWKHVRASIWSIARALLLGLIVGALAAEAAGFFLLPNWPNERFVHIVAAAVALLVGYAFAATAAIIEGVQGLTMAVRGVDDVVKATVGGGINVLDAAVDAVDGPDRHGFTGRRN